MALELIAGAVLGTAVNELLNAVKDARKKISSFEPILKRLESTLTTITPDLDEITLQNQKLDPSGTGITDLIALVGDGKELVVKCSKLHRLNYVKKVQYSKLLLDLENNLLRYFVTVLQLDQSKDIKKILLLYNEPHCKFLPAGSSKDEMLDELVVETGDETSNRNPTEIRNDLRTDSKGEISKLSVKEPENKESVKSKEISVDMEDEAECSSSSLEMEALIRRTDDQEYSDKAVMTRKDRAREALLKINAGDKRALVRNYVDTLKLQSGDGVSTKVVLYNATGDTVRLVGTHDWFGQIGHAPYPLQIENGEWGGFLHVKTAGVPSGSVGAVVYRGKNLKDEYCDWMLSWSNPWARFLHDNRVYAEIREAHHYEQDHWGYISDILDRSARIHKDIWNGCSSSVTSGTGTTVVVEAILTLVLDVL